MPVTTTRFKPATAMWSSVDEDGEAVDDIVLDLECCATLCVRECECQCVRECE